MACRKAAVLAAFGVMGCDIGAHVESGRGPPLHVVAVSPEDGEGEDCPVNSPDDCGVPIGSPIEIRFDRYLLPSSVTRQSIAVFTGSTDNGIFLAPTYDILERVVSYRPEYGSQLTPGVVYQVELPLPDEDDFGFGFRAFDGVALEKGRVPLKWSFRTSRVAAPPASSPPAPSCDDVLATFSAAGCVECHSGDRAPMGLSLASSSELRETAIGQVAHETSTWATPAVALDDPPRFGAAMALMAPGNPSTSYLTYKLLENPRNFEGNGSCSTRHAVALPKGQCLLAPTAERQRLGDWFVQGEPMPPGNRGLPGGVDDLRTILEFIQTSTGQCK